jgi:hypothetical protein
VVRVLDGLCCAHGALRDTVGAVRYVVSILRC